MAAARRRRLQVFVYTFLLGTRRHAARPQLAARRLRFHETTLSGATAMAAAAITKNATCAGDTRRWRRRSRPSAALQSPILGVSPRQSLTFVECPHPSVKSFTCPDCAAVAMSLAKHLGHQPVPDRRSVGGAQIEQTSGIVYGPAMGVALVSGGGQQRRRRRIVSAWRRPRLIAPSRRRRRRPPAATARRSSCSSPWCSQSRWGAATKGMK